MRNILNNLANVLNMVIIPPYTISGGDYSVPVLIYFQTVTILSINNLYSVVLVI
nr:MAG TPA: hypothetical protein [Caudoviricetes sp.]